MLKINKEIVKKEVSFVLCDFDRTISVADSETSWGIFSKSHLTTESFKKETKDIFNIYRPIEINYRMSETEKMQHMHDWPCKQVMLFPKHFINFSLYKRIIRETPGIVLRKDFVNFVINMYNLNIPIYIVSAGLKEPIDHTLIENRCMLPNVSVIANKVSVADGDIIGLQEPVLHSLNKNLITLPMLKDKQGLLFGDLPGDKKIGNNLNTINVGFVNDGKRELYEREFDITLTEESSFDDVGKVLFKKYYTK